MTFNTYNFNNCNQEGRRTYSHLVLKPKYEGSCNKKSNTKKEKYNSVSLSTVHMLFLFPLFYSILLFVCQPFFFSNQLFPHQVPLSSCAYKYRGMNEKQEGEKITKGRHFLDYREVTKNKGRSFQIENDLENRGYFLRR